MKQKMDSKCQSTLQLKSQKESQFCSIMSDLWILTYFAKKIFTISNILHASAKGAKIPQSLTHSIVLTYVLLVKRDLLLNMTKMTTLVMIAKPSLTRPKLNILTMRSNTTE